MAFVSEERNRFVADANSTISFKIIRNTIDLIDTKNAFHPKFSHQFFGENETIFGYTDLRIKLYYAACTLDIYLGISYDQKAKIKVIEPDDIVSIIRKQLQCGFSTSSDAFAAKLSKQVDFRPFGDLLHSYEIEQGAKRRFEIYKISEATPAFISHYEKMQTFAMWFIDAASYIDTDDPMWKYYVLYENYRDDEGNTCFAFCGYSCVYHYYAYPEHIRPRIGHILILPPFQKRGHGIQLLQTIYNDLIRDSKVLDITAEDPSDHFILLRDYVDCTNCSRLATFLPSKLKDGFSKVMVEEARTKLKMTKKQARRVYEILRFKTVNAKDAEEFKKFRLEIKRRLYAPFQKDKRDWQKLRKALNSQELAATAAVQLSDEQRMQTLQKQFEDLLDVYRITLNRMAMSYDTPLLNLPNEKRAGLERKGESNGHSEK